MPCSREPARRRLLVLEAAQGDVEARAIVAGEPPGEEPRHPVDAGAADAELVADVEDRDAHAARAAAAASAALPLAIHTIAPESESSTISPAPTSENARALSRGQADLREVEGEQALAQAPAVERDGQGLQQRAERDHQERGAGLERDAEGAGDGEEVEDGQRLDHEARGPGRPDDPHPRAVDVHGPLHDLELLAGPSRSSRGGRAPSAGAPCPAGRRRRRAPRRGARGPGARHARRPARARAAGRRRTPRRRARTARRSRGRGRSRPRPARRSWSRSASSRRGCVRCRRRCCSGGSC